MAKRKKANGGGTLEKRGNIWRARWVVDGKTFTKSTGTGDRREAEKVLADLVRPTQARTDKERLENLAARIAGREAEIKRFEDGKPALAVADAFEAYARHPDAPDTGEDTLARYKAQYGRLVEWLHVHYPELTELRQVSKSVAYAFLEDFKPGVSANTFNKHVVLYRRIWNVLAETARLAGGNPWASVKMRKLDESVRRELTAAELAEIGKHVDGEMARLFATGVFTGLRLGDAVRLDWSKIDLAAMCIRIIPRKTARYANGRPVVIPIVAPFAAILSAVPKAERKGPLCPELAELAERDEAAVSDRIQRVFKECGIETHAAEVAQSGRARVAVGFHSLRHTFVSIAAEHGVPLAIVQAVVGHTSLAMTRHYTHVGEEAARRHLAVFPDVFGTGAGGTSVPALEAPQNASVDVEGEVRDGCTVELDAATLAKLDAVRREGESLADAVRRAVETLAAKR